MKTLYISGSITDLKTGKPREGWQEEFHAAERKLRTMGFNVVNPVDIAKEIDDEWRQQWDNGTFMVGWKGQIQAFKEPTRATYISACLQVMNFEALANRLQGMYVLGLCNDPFAKPSLYHSDGVQMELRMARVLGIPVFAQFNDDSEVDVHLQPVTEGRRLLVGGRFGTERQDKGQ